MRSRLFSADRRALLGAGFGAALLGAGCQPDQASAHIVGSFTGIQHERGHRLQSALTGATPAITRRTDVLIAGGGVAGLAAARALRLKGVEDFALLELEDAAGGNARAGEVNGIPCPLGAHYLPLPGDDAWEVQDLLEELGLRTRRAGRWVYDERHLCHSPQERLFFNGAWQPGLLPLQGVGATTLAQYQKFAALVAQLRHQVRWTIPVSKQPPARVQQSLAAMTFVAYLDQNGLTDAHLRWYLDYCCRDDYGAGLRTVSAWAGMHYFASRHGFAAPGMDNAETDGLLTWPEGNAWLTRRLAAPLGPRLQTGQVVLRINHQKHAVEVDAFNTRTQQLERWQARRAIVALPVFVAARVVQNPPDWLRAAAARMVYAPWLVANLHITSPLQDRPGAPPSWDNVVYGDSRSAPGLGYVDASHQGLHSVPGATVLTYYRALGDLAADPGSAPLAPGVAGRRLLLSQPWAHWRDAILAELSGPHPDLAAKVRRIDLTRYGHAMAVPVPRVNGQIGLWPGYIKHSSLSKTEQIKLTHGRLSFAHSDWAGYSVFEEAFTLGHGAA
ncbi:FAD-dependent oxidoreductase [Rhodoferax sp.]|uniref:FAD-dependent oxidoreductase n=1 Tax=Rhodoferax sp. TaxID=50421 RepID=UPI0026032B36|nr:FAD-dependent oxidoreductase [Rhodoferax sp.]MDD2925442.1 FAD-dependent oxidoreductase [Rhodoferax sp.]